MVLEVKRIVFYARKLLRLSIKLSVRSARDHPFLFYLGLFLLALYRCSPALFAFLVSSSPVIVCTALLLGTLLSYGEPNTIPRVEEHEKISKANVGSRDEIHEREIYEEIFRDRTDSTEMDEVAPLLGTYHESDPIQATADEVHVDGDIFGDRTDSADPDEVAPLLRTYHESNPILVAADVVHEDIEVEEKQGVEEQREVLVQDPKEGYAGSSRGVYSRLVHGWLPRAPDTVKGDAMDDLYPDTTADQRWRQPDDDDDGDDESSGFDSDGAETLSPDASVTDIAPVLDEIDPLLGPASSQLSAIPNEDLDADSNLSSEDNNEDEDSGDETENQETEQRDGKQRKEEDKDAAFIWTEDDAKNLMEVGYSELERNRRLESLIARHKWRRAINFSARNQFDRPQIAPISVPRRNPFDLPFDSEESAIPGSAPSVFHPRRNPFDSPRDQPFEGDTLVREPSTPKVSTTMSQREMFFRRHESFNFGGAGATHDRRFSSLRPVFVAENAGYSGEEISSNIQQQFSDRSESKRSSAAESESASSSVMERDELQEYQLMQDKENDDNESQSSDGINSVKVELDGSDIDDREITMIFMTDVHEADRDLRGESSSSMEYPKLAEMSEEAYLNDEFSTSEMMEFFQSSEISNLESSPHIGMDNSHAFSRDLHPIPEESLEDVKSESFVSVQTTEEQLQSELPFPAEPSNPFVSEVTASDANLEEVAATAAAAAASSGQEEDLKLTAELVEDSDNEVEKVYPEPLEYDGMNDDLLSELDAVGDFRAEGLNFHLIDDHQGGNTANYAGNLGGEYVSLNDVTEATLKESEELRPLLDQSRAANVEGGWWFGSSNSDPERTVYNPRRRVLDVASWDGANTLYELVCSESQPHLDSKPSSLESVTENVTGIVFLDAQTSEDITSTISRMAHGAENADRSNASEDEMVFLHAQSHGDILSGFEQVVQDHKITELWPNQPALPEDGAQGDALTDEMVFLHAQSHSHLLSAFEQVAQDSIKKEIWPSQPVLPKDDACGNASKDEIVFLHAQSHGDILSAFQQAIQDSEMELGLCQPVLPKGDAQGDALKDEMVFLHAQSHDDIVSAFEQVAQHHKKMDFWPSQPVLQKDDARGNASKSEMVFLDAQSHGDILSAFKQVVQDSEMEVGSSKPILPEDGAQGNALTDEMAFLHEQSHGDILSAFKQVAQDPQKTEFWPGQPAPPKDDAHGNVSNDEMVFLDAQSHSHILSAFKQVVQDSEMELGSSQPVELPKGAQGDALTNEIVFLHAQTYGDILSAFEQVAQDPEETELWQTQPVLPKDDACCNASKDEIVFLHAQSHSDILSAFQQAVQDSKMELSSSQPVLPKDDALTDEMVFLHAQSPGDIFSAFEQVARYPNKTEFRSIHPVFPKDDAQGDALTDEIVFLHAQSPGDILSAFEQVARDPNKTEFGSSQPVLQNDNAPRAPIVFHEAQSPDDILSVFEQVGSMSDIRFVDAKSHEDIHLAFKQVTASLEEVVLRPSRSPEPEIVHLDAQTHEDIRAAFDRFAQAGVDKTQAGSAEITFLDAQSHDDIRSAFKQVTDQGALEVEHGRTAQPVPYNGVNTSDEVVFVKSFSDEDIRSALQ